MTIGILNFVPFSDADYFREAKQDRQAAILKIVNFGIIFVPRISPLLIPVRDGVNSREERAVLRE